MKVSPIWTASCVEVPRELCAPRLAMRCQGMHAVSEAMGMLSRANVGQCIDPNTLGCNFLTLANGGSHLLREVGRVYTVTHLGKSDAKPSAKSSAKMAYLCCWHGVWHGIWHGIDRILGK